MSQGEYVAAVYAVVFAVVLVYVAMMAAKLVRLQRQTAELLKLAERRRQSGETGAQAVPTQPRAEAT